MQQMWEIGRDNRKRGIKMENVIYISLFSWLLLLSWQDIRKKEVSLFLLLAGVVIVVLSIGTGIRMGQGTSLWISKGIGMLMGISLILLSKASKGQIGMGDAIVLTVTGIVFGFWDNLFLFFYSLILSAVYTAVLLLMKRIHKKQNIAFLPFIVLGTLGVIFG